MGLKGGRKDIPTRPYMAKLTTQSEEATTMYVIKELEEITRRVPQSTIADIANQEPDYATRFAIDSRNFKNKSHLYSTVEAKHTMYRMSPNPEKARPKPKVPPNSPISRTTLYAQ